MALPFSFLISTPENLAITPSLKLNLISVGEVLLETSAAGLADFSMGWAFAEVASRPSARTANVPIDMFFRAIVYFLLVYCLLKAPVMTGDLIRQAIGVASGVTPLLEL